MNNRQKGKIGEGYAKSFLKHCDYDFIEANYYSKFGEIDLIFNDYSNGHEIVFIEVKARTSYNFGYPSEAITKLKINKIERTAIKYLEDKKIHKNIKWRIDAISVIMERNLEFLSIDHIKNISDG